MKKNAFWLALVAASFAEAGVTFRELSVPDAPFAMPALRECVFPARDFAITDYGAKPGVKCTDAIAKAMAACEAAGGGRVVVPKGAWLTGAVRFRSNCNLHLEDGAVLEFTDDPADYPKVHTTWEGVECLNHSPLLFAYEVENVAITGGGLVRPRMDFWRTWFARPPAHMYATEQLYHWCSTNAPMASRDLMAIKGSNVRPHLIQFNRCKNVLLDGIRIKESPFWMIHLYHSENCIVRNVSAYAHGNNNDGVDVDMSQNVLIEKCSFDQGDDGIVLKAGRNADAWRLNCPTMNVVVRDCDLHTSHSLLGIGSELSGGIRNVWMTRCRADMTFNALKIKTSPRRGGFVENIYIDHCFAGEVIRVAHIQTDYYCQYKAFPDYELRYTKIRNINIDGLDVRKAEVAFQLDGDWHCRPKGLHFSNISVGAVLEQFTDIRNCEDVTLENVKLREDDGTQLFCLNKLLPVKGKVGELTEGHRRAAAFFQRPDYTDGTLADGVYDLGAGAVAIVEEVVLSPFNDAVTHVDESCDRFYGIVRPGDFACFKHGDYNQVMGLWHDEWAYFPAGYKFCDKLTIGSPGKVRLVVITVRKGMQDDGIGTARNSVAQDGSSK